MTLIEWAAALERTGKTLDGRIAKYIRTHKVRIEGWLFDSLKTLGRAATREDREDLTQVALMAVTQVVQTADPEAALNQVKNMMANTANRQKAWNGRKVEILGEEN
jgi:hypothetical protein